MRRFSTTISLILSLTGTSFLGCAKPLPPPQGSLPSPSGRFWLQMAAGQAGQQNLLLVSAKGGASVTLLEGVKNFCDTHFRWAGDDVALEIPLPSTRHLKVQDGFNWKGVTVRVATHQRQVRMARVSPSRNQSLVLIEDCEQTQWSLYLRPGGEGAYSPALLAGQEDPQRLGWGDWTNPVQSIEWTGAADAKVVVGGRPGKPSSLKTVKHPSVDLQWVVDPTAGPPMEDGAIAQAPPVPPTGAKPRPRTENPDGDRHVVYEPSPSPAGAWRVWLASRQSGEKLLLADGLPSLEGVSIWWMRPDQLAMEFPNAMRPMVKVQAEQRWKKTRLTLGYHE